MVVLDNTLLIHLFEDAGHAAKMSDNRLVVCADLVGGKTVELFYTLSSPVLYDLPQFMVDLVRYPFLGSLPHVGSTGIVCAYDSDNAFPNPEKSEQALVDVFKRTVETLNKGLLGGNETDYEDELQSYWSFGDKLLTAYYFDELPLATKQIYAAASQCSEHACLCMATEKKTLTRVVSHLSRKEDSEIETFPCLHIRLNNPLSNPLPITCTEWEREIAKSGDAVLRSYRQFVTLGKNKHVFIVLSVPVGEGVTSVCFSQPSVPARKGFRKGDALYKYSIAKTEYGSLSVSRLILKDASQRHLFKRGGDGKTLNEKYTIVGCGALGGHLAQVLADSGVQRLMLLDRELLELENIARHICGFGSIGKMKVDAIKTLLEESNPNIECTAIGSDANSALDSNPRKIADTDFIFITAADYPLENHYLTAKSNGLIQAPIIIMWLEPFVFAAHALVVNKPQDIMSDYFNAELSFYKPIVANAQSLFQRDAGCRSTYMPYSGLDVQSFLLDFLRDWQKGMMGNSDANYHFVWFGRLSDAENLGARLSPGVDISQEYTHYFERID